MLSPFEVSLLRSLEVGKEYYAEEASKTAKISKNTVLKAAYLLQDKGYAEVKEVLKKSYKLTEEGKEYLKSGLPEERLFKILKERREVELSELEKEFGKALLGIALGWLKRKKAVEVKNGRVALIRDKVRFEERDALKLIAEGKWREVSKDILKNLLRRKLIEEEEEKEIFVRILQKPKVELKEFITILPPN